MKFCFAGTGAADWEHDDITGFHRFNTSYIIDEKLLIDPGPTLFAFSEKHGVSLRMIHNIIVTHSHGDHFNASTLSRLAEENGEITVFGHPAIEKLIPSGLRFVPVTPFEEFSIPGYSLKALPANHSTSIKEEQPYHYVISDGEKRLFYGCDGAWLQNKTFAALRKLRFDAMIFDCTCGEAEGEYRIFEHNTIPMLEYMLSTIRLAFPAMLAEDAKIYASHLARTLHTDHEALALRLSRSDIIAAYDGMLDEI